MPDAWREEIKVDKFDLDNCSEIHTNLVDKTSELYVKYLNLKETWKDKLERKEADIGDNVRADPGRFGLEKITEKAVRGIVVRDEEYMELNDQFHTYLKKFTKFNQRLRTLDHRRAMLELLTRQWERGYYSEVRRPPTPPRTTGPMRRED